MNDLIFELVEDFDIKTLSRPQFNNFLRELKQHDFGKETVLRFRIKILPQ